MPVKLFKSQRHISWKWWLAIIVYLLGFAGFLLGVELSERPGIPESDVFTKAYYTLGLFVLGGLDLGTPKSGPFTGLTFLWIAYFAAPILTASALIDTLLHIFAPRSLGLRRLKNHILIIGSSELTSLYLQKLRETDKRTKVVVVIREADESEIEELSNLYNVKILVGNSTHEFVLSRLHIEKAKRILLFSNSDFINYEAASLILNSYPQIADRIIVHVSDLRFMRIMETSEVARCCTTFNQYHLSAETLVKRSLLQHFKKTMPKDVIVFVGFGRFGQSILEELQDNAISAFDRIVIMDKDAQRRVLVTDEQIEQKSWYHREVIDGDIRNPIAWQKVLSLSCLQIEEPVFILGTGDDTQNLRTAVWLHQKYPKALIITRTQTPSSFTKSVCDEHDIVNISVTELIEQGMPKAWYTHT